MYSDSKIAIFIFKTLTNIIIIKIKFKQIKRIIIILINIHKYWINKNAKKILCNIWGLPIKI